MRMCQPRQVQVISTIRFAKIRPRSPLSHGQNRSRWQTQYTGYYPLNKPSRWLYFQISSNPVVHIFRKQWLGLISGFESLVVYITSSIYIKIASDLAVVCFLWKLHYEIYDNIASECLTIITKKFVSSMSFAIARAELLKVSSWLSVSGGKKYVGKRKICLKCFWCSNSC